ncbi:MAG: ubiquinone/menaquinone biosynthesis methyltransferase [Thermoplasmatota archaeon]
MSREVQAMFGGIAPRYDRANRILSWGVDGRWRRVALKFMGPLAGRDVLDVACGTGDLASAARRRGAHVTGVDFSLPMLREALAKEPLAPWVAGDALRLPFRDASFDALTIGFGIRNLDDPVAGLREMRRVVRPGGHILVLEFGQPRGPWGLLYRWYASTWIPRIGGRVTGRRAAYEYLPRTAAAFPSGSAFVALLSEAGWGQARFRRLSGGIAFAYVAG